jgi:hypothetical protein
VGIISNNLLLSFEPGKPQLQQNFTSSEVEVEVILWLTVSQSVSQYVVVYFFLSFARKLLCSSSWGALSDERTGL